MTDQIVSLSKKLITIPSIKGDTENLHLALKIAKQPLENFNRKEFSSNNVPSALFYNTQDIPEKFKIILNAHLDVVNAPRKQFNPIERNGKLLGRGAYDMKATTAAMILVFREVAEKVNYSIGLQIVTDEEIGGYNGAKYQIDQGIRAEFAITGEPTDMHIVNEFKGMLRFRVSFHGKTAHGAYPWRGENAIWKMTHFLAAIEKEFPVPKEQIWKSTVNLATIETTNKTFNMVPNDCSASFDLRFVPEEEATILERVKKLLPPDAEFSITVKEHHHFTHEDNPFIQMLHEKIHHVSGEIPVIRANQGSGDLRYFTEVGGNGVEFGPLGGGHHSDDEWVDIQSLGKYYDILKDFLLSLS
jgi:succinyl-diaminopimelate desuccinylase